MDELNTGSEIAEKSLPLLKDFLSKVFGPSVDEFGLQLKDNMVVRRFKNQVRNLEKVKKIAEENNLNIKQVDLKVLFPYLEGVSLEEDEKLQDIWANLFLNYIDMSKNLNSHVYPSILKQISSKEVSIITYLKESHYIKAYSTDNPTDFKYDDMANLERLGIIREESIYNVHGAGTFDSKDMRIEEDSSGKFSLTSFGIDFYQACSR